MPSRVRPLVVRPGARYRCFGDGLCCTDVHLLGPLTRKEVVRLKVIDARSSKHDELLDAPVLRTRKNGACLFLDERGCSLHADLGAHTKPASCRRFPYRLVGTPHGGRVVTEHRCPCRTMGARPRLDVADAEASLADDHGRLQADARVPDMLKKTKTTRISFATYARLEAQWLARILGNEDVLDVLGGHRELPELHSASWLDVAHLLRARIDGSACGDALAWFGDTLLELLSQREGARDDPRMPSKFRTRARPWSEAFDRAEARSPNVDHPGAIIADFVADALWSLEWVGRTSLDGAFAELSVRVIVARAIVDKLFREGARADRAAAEAVTIVELAGASGVWNSVVRELA